MQSGRSVGTKRVAAVPAVVAVSVEVEHQLEKVQDTNIWGEEQSNMLILYSYL